MFSATGVWQVCVRHRVLGTWEDYVTRIAYETRGAATDAASSLQRANAANHPNHPERWYARRVTVIAK